jgi:hypothetical protein
MFAQKYPAFAALLALVGAVAQDAAVQGETVLQKLEASINLVPQALAFFPQVSALSSELAALKASPGDMEAAAEALVSDLAFSSAKAKAIIAAAFPLAESLVGLVPQVQALLAAV